MRRILTLLLCAGLTATTIGCGLLDEEETTDDSLQRPQPTGNAETDALAGVNYYRALAGLPEVTIDSTLSAGCQQHVAYMAQNQVLTHEEDPELPGFSPAGDASGRASNVAAGQDDLIEAVDTWMSGPYHRFPIIDPGLTRIGAAVQDRYACLDVLSGFSATDGFDPILVPSPDQTGVPRMFPGDERPDPLVNTPYAAPTGYIISVTFAPSAEVSADTSVTLWLGNVPQAEATQLPGDEEDPNSHLMRNSLYVVPETPLQANTEYRVTVNGVVDGTAYNNEWTFRTGG